MFVSLLKAFESQEAGKCQINALFSVVITDQVRQKVYLSILYLLKGWMNPRNENDERSRFREIQECSLGAHEVLGCVLKTFPRRRLRSDVPWTDKRQFAKKTTER